MSTTAPKPVVYYRADKAHIIRVGQPAIIYPYAHPSDRVTGDGETPAQTSPVGALDALTGEFWTLNTHYKPRMD